MEQGEQSSGRKAAISQKQLHSPYAGWFDVKALHSEYERIQRLAPAASAIVMRWRRNRLWQIGQRLKEIKR